MGSNALDKLLAKTGKTRSDIKSGSKIGKALRRGGVENSPELQRILALPRRSLRDARLCIPQSIRRATGKQELRPHQALALYETYVCRGGYFPMRVGSGKTLVTLLLTRILQAQKSVLLLPAALTSKTVRDFLRYLEHWDVILPELVSYTGLADPATCDALEVFMPDLIIADEAQNLRNPRAKCTRVVERYMERNPKTVFVGLSATLLGSSMLDTPHIARWALGTRSPIPNESTCNRWREALDPKTPVGRRLHYGELERFGTPVPDAYRRWIEESPGVVAVSTRGCDAAIEIGRWRSPQPCKELIDEVELTGCRPDGELLSPAEVASCVSQLALGFWYRWNPLPPLHWLAARREWTTFVRHILESGYELGIDSEHDVKRAYPDAWRAWSEVKKTFEPNVETVWVSDEVVRAAEEWTQGRAAVIYNKFRAVMERARLPYHGDQGLDSRGRHIEEASGPVWASIRSCGVGVNLQHYNRALLVSPMASAELYEQLIGRFHREGQDADLIDLEIIKGCGYHDNVVRRVRNEAQAVHDSGREQKLVIATWK